MTAKLTLTQAPEGSESRVIETSDLAQICALLIEDKVESLKLDSTLTKSENLQKITPILPSCNNLEAIDVSGGSRDAAAMAELYEAVLYVPNLRELQANQTYVGSQNGDSIAAVINNHPTLDKLSIRHNTLYVPGTQSVADAIAHNGGIREMDISFNAMGAPGVDLLADALETNKGLVKIDVSTTYDIKPSIPNIERMLETNKNLIECKGLTSETIEAKLAENHAEAQKLADALHADPAGLDSAQREALNDRMASATYLLEHEKGMSREEVLGALTSVLTSGKDHGVDTFPAMMAVMPFREMLDLSDRMGNPLKANDFFDPKHGATPLLSAVIERGVAPQIFNTSMQWESVNQLMGAYHTLPESQKEQVFDLHLLRAQVRISTEQGAGRSMIG